MIRRRTLLYVLLALAVPLPALALSAGGVGSPSLAVGASLDRCGTAANQIVCKINASWSSVPGGTRYTARVTRPDGSVIDYGDVGPGGTSFWVPYVGNGTYTVTVAAYGTKRGSGEPELLAKSSSGTGGKANARRRTATAAGRGVGATPDPAEDPSAGGPGSEPTEHSEPGCEDEPDDPEEPPGANEPAGAAEAPAAEQAVAPGEDAPAGDEDAEDPEPPECPEAGATP